MILSPEEYTAASTGQLLREAARGYVAFDHRFLRTVLGRGEAVIPEFIEFLKEAREDDRIETEQVLIEMVRHLRTAAAMPFLAEVARVNDFSFPDDLTEAFVDLGANSVDTLLALYEEGDHASDAAFALAGLGAHDPRILEVLTAHLQQDPVDAAIMLGLYGDPAAKPALEKALAEAGENADAKMEIENALEEIEHTDETRPEPFDIFPLYPEEDAPYFAAFDHPELIEFLKSPVADYRARAVKMLGFEEPPAELVRVIFGVAQNDPDPHVRAFAWEALEGIHEPKEIEQALHRKLDDTSAMAEERAGALVALAHEADHFEKIPRLILEFYENPDTRAQAVKAMWHSGERRFEKQIVAALDDQDLLTKRQAITAVGIFGIVSQLGKLESFFEEEELREASLYAYALAAPSDDTPARMRKLFRKVEDLAGGLSDDESMLVGKALDDRLEANEYDPIFLHQDSWHEEHEEEAATPEPPAAPAKVGRNDPCPCGSGKKYKKCCGQNQ